MKIDCKNLACPEPLIKTKNAIESMKIGDVLEVVVNEIPPRENIKRFLTTNNFEYEISENKDETIIKTVKTKELSNTSTEGYTCEVVLTPEVKKKKVIYLNDDQAGSGPIGRDLLSKFLGAVMNLPEKPVAVICVNNAVLMTTNRAHVSYQALKNLENAGVKIYTCGSCLESYKLVDKLSIGDMTNAYEVMELLTNNEAIKL
ncbi:MAG: sulfurtransferase-like selenium metabolism protein YedF [Campylobacteraceae bacterium]|nr:sulfurtransferase-like selenium metabolism protein YedF [Campylobacteraceae bacterium]